jgi:aerobic carbon-monoxide dehydrogenase large subunit
MERLVGTRVTRVEDPRILSGRGRYVDDVQLPGMLHAAFLRSPFPHARVLGVQAIAAREAPGVALVLTGAEITDLALPFVLMGPEGMHCPPYPALATDKVRMTGDPVAVVVATTRAAAEDACELIEVDYEELRGVASMEQALDDASAPVWDDLGHNVAGREHYVHGDPDAAFEGAARIVRERFVQSRQTQVPMEGRGGVADFDPASGRLTYHSAWQGVSMTRFALANQLQMPVHQVTVVNGDIGGSFGQKTFVRSEDVCIAVASRLLGRPVKWIEDRTENLTVAGHAREEAFDVQAAVDADGAIRGVKIEVVLDQGAYPTPVIPSSMFTNTMRVMFPGAYRIRDMQFDTTIVFTNKAMYTAYRGPWEAETWVRERLLDRIAQELDLDPVEVRRRNLLSDDEMPCPMVTGPTLSGITLRSALDKAERVAGYADFRAEQERARAEGRYLGLGIATFIEAAPGPPDYGPAIGFALPPERAMARLEADGTLVVHTSQAPHGQGHETTLAQVAADALGVPMSSVRVVHGDSRTSPFAMMGTGGSRAATVATGAVLGAAREVRSQVAAVAAHLFEASPDDIEVVDGVAQVRGTPSVAMPLAQVAMTAWMAPQMLPPGMSAGIEATFDFAAGDGGWTQSVHSCFVEVDVETGVVDIRRYVVVEDCGDVINPAIVEGQIRGGIAQGIAGVLYEHAAYDEHANFRTATFMDYLVPTASEIPPIEIHHVDQTVTTQEVNSRGVGEGGAIGAPAAVTNAIEDALRPFGVKVTDQYLPPARILELVGAIPTPA